MDEDGEEGAEARDALGQPRDPNFESVFRPLLASTLGAGAMVAAVLGFIGEVWGKLSPAAEQVAAVAAQTALIVFVLLVGLSGLSFAVGAKTNAAFARVMNLLGVAAFAGGVFVVGRNISTSLFLGRDGDAPLPDDVATFFGLIGLALLALAAWGAVGGARRVAPVVADMLQRLRVNQQREAQGESGPGPDEQPQSVDTDRGYGGDPRHHPPQL